MGKKGRKLTRPTPGTKMPASAQRPMDLEYARRHIRQLYETSKLLANFESVDRTVPAVFALATSVLHIRIAILVERSGGRPTTSAWHASSVGQDELVEATKAARTNFAYLAGSP